MTTHKTVNTKVAATTPTEKRAEAMPASAPEPVPFDFAAAFAVLRERCRASDDGTIRVGQRRVGRRWLDDNEDRVASLQTTLQALLDATAPHDAAA